MFGRKRLYTPPPAAPPQTAQTAKPPPTDDEQATSSIEAGRWQDVAALGGAAVPALRRYLSDEGPFATDYGREKASEILVALANSGERSALEALLALGRGSSILGEAAIDSLRSIAAGADDSVRVAAVETLGNIGSDRAAPTLYEAWVSETSPNSRLRFAAETALRRCGWAHLPPTQREELSARLVAPLAAVLEDSGRSSEWRSAAATLAATRDPGAVEALVSFLAGSKGQRERRDWEEAAFAAERMAPTEQVAEDVLRGLLANPNARVREAAISDLADRAGAGATGLLVTCLRDPSRSARRSAAAALERRGWAPATEEEEISLLVALGYHGQAAARGAAALDLLLGAARERDYQSGDDRKAVEAIGRVRDPRATEALAGLLADEDRELALAAARALGTLGDLRGATTLGEAFRDKTDSRIPLARALAACGVAATMRDALKALVERSAPLLRSPEPAGVAAFLRDAAPHLPREPICTAYRKSSSSDDFPQEWERNYEEPGFLLEGKPSGGDVEKLANHREGPGGLDAADFSGRGDEAVWLLPSGHLLQVTSTHYSMHAARSSSHRDWTAEAEPLEMDVLVSDPKRAIGAVIRCTQPLLERQLELDGELARRESPA